MFPTPTITTAATPGHHHHHSWSHQQQYQYQQSQQLQQQYIPYLPIAMMPGVGVGHMMQYANNAPTDFLTDFGASSPPPFAHHQTPHFGTYTDVGPSGGTAYPHADHTSTQLSGGPPYHHDYVAAQKQHHRHQRQHQKPVAVGGVRAGQKRRGTTPDRNDLELPSSPPKKVRLQHQPFTLQETSKRPPHFFDRPVNDNARVGPQGTDDSPQGFSRLPPSII